MNSIKDIIKLVDLGETKNLNIYIEELRAKTQGLSDVEKLRYAYIDLGKRIKFDPYYAAANNGAYMNKVYADSAKPEVVDNSIKHGYMICKTACYIMQAITKELTSLDMRTIVHPYYSFTNLPHVVNAIPISEDEYMTLDLVNDSKYIQSGMRTTHFGRVFKQNKATGELERTDHFNFSREELAVLDKKCGYISDKKVYSDEYYFELMKYYTEMISSFKEKLNLFFTNCDQPEISQKLGEIEAIWLHRRVMRELFPRKNARGEIEYDYMGDIMLDRRISSVMGSEKLGKKGERHFEMFIVAEQEGEPYDTRDMYIYDDNNHKYNQISLGDFYKMCHNKKYWIPDSLTKLKLLETYEAKSQRQ